MADTASRKDSRAPRRVYFDNAATSYPKPPEVWDAMDRFAREGGASAGRGAYAEAFDCARMIAECRERLARLFGAPDPARFLFTLNTTGALNLALKGLLEPGDHVVTTALEHKSILRPLNAMAQRGEITFTAVPCAADGSLDPAEIRRALRPNTRLIATLHGSNVCGILYPVEEIAAIAREAGVVFLLDAAQTAGAVPLNFTALGLDLVAFPGHKSLLGPLGTGALWVREGLELRTVTEGGTGSLSERDTQPDFWPDRHEAGSHNAHGLAGLHASLGWILERGVAAIRAQKLALVAELARRLRAIEGVSVYGPARPEHNAGVVSIRARGWTPMDLALELDRRWRINVRPGVHCAPGAHQTLGTFPEGTTRFSLGPFLTQDDVALAAEAVAALARERARTA